MKLIETELKRGLMLAHVAASKESALYDPAPDGKPIVALAAADTAEGSHDRVIFLLNFFDELRRRVPVGMH